MSGWVFRKRNKNKRSLNSKGLYRRYVQLKMSFENDYCNAATGNGNSMVLIPSPTSAKQQALQRLRDSSEQGVCTVVTRKRELLRKSGGLI